MDDGKEAGLSCFNIQEFRTVAQKLEIAAQKFREVAPKQKIVAQKFRAIAPKQEITARKFQFGHPESGNSNLKVRNDYLEVKTGQLK